MKMLDRRTRRVLGMAVACVALCIGLAACAPQPEAESTAADSETTEQVEASADGMYVSDEQCLSCHGGSYEALASTTADYGLSNPHDSIHGGPNSCVNCHARDKEITDNQCTHCHDWPHNPTSGLGATA